jgi:hypothetical protein
MTQHHASPLLRRSLLIDSAISGATGLLMLLDAPALQDVLGLPAALARGAGIVLLPFAGFVLALWRRDPPPRAGVLAVIAANAAWVLGSLALLLAGGIGLNALGSALVLAQALAVAAFAALQYAGLQRSAWRHA